MYYTTGFHRDEIVDLCSMINELPIASRDSWPPILGLFKSVVIALTYMRRNRVQWELAETYGVSQSTISRAITVLTPLLANALKAAWFQPLRAPSAFPSNSLSFSLGVAHSSVRRGRPLRRSAIASSSA